MTPTQILRRLQQNERLPERSRQRLRLRECGLQGLIACLPEGTVSPQLCQGLYKLFLGAGTPGYSQVEGVTCQKNRASRQEEGR